MTIARRFGRGISASFLSNLWLAALSLFLTPLYFSFLGVDGYGLIGFYASLAAIFGVLDMCISATATWQISWLCARSEEKDKIPSLLRSLEVAYWGTIVVLGVALLTFFWLFGADWFQAKELSPELVWQALMLMAVSVVFQISSGLYTGGLLGLQRQEQCAALRAFFGSLRGFGSILALWLISPDIRVFFLWQFAISLVQSGVTRSVLWCQVHADGSAPKFSWDRLRSVQTFWGGITLVTLLSVIVSQADKMILSRKVPLGDFGYYMLAWSVASVLDMMSTPLMQAFGPHYTRLASVRDNKNLAKGVRLASQAMSLVILPPAGFIMFMSEPMLEIWLGNAVVAAGTAPILSVMVAGTSLIACSYPALQLLYSKNKLAPIIRLHVLIIVVLLPFLFFVVEYFGMLGAAFCWVLYGFVLFFFYRVLALSGLSDARIFYDTQRDFIIPCAVSLLMAGLISRLVAGITDKAVFVIVTALALLLSWVLVLATCKDLRLAVIRRMKWV